MYGCKMAYFSDAIFWEFTELARGLRLHLRPQLLNQSRFMHLKMTVWTSVLWRWTYIYGKKVARNGRTTVIYERHSFRNRVYFNTLYEMHMQHCSALCFLVCTLTHTWYFYVTHMVKSRGPEGSMIQAYSRCLYLYFWAYYGTTLFFP